MTRLELIKAIGDVLTQLDVLRGSLLSRDPMRIDLDKARKELDSKQLLLVKKQFDENTIAFKDLAKQFDLINLDLQATIDDLANLQTTFTNLTKLAAVLDNITNLIV